MNRAVFISLLWLGFSLPLFGQRTITVDLDGGGDFTEIQPAIDAAEDRDTVLVKPGEYVITESIKFNRLSGAKNVVVRSEEGAEETIIRMAEQPADPREASVVIFNAGESTLEGFTLTGGKATRSPWGPMGGGVLCYAQASPILIACTISGNFSERDGGGVSSFGSPTFTNCTITGNSARLGEGGGVLCGSNSATFTNCTITGNSAGLGGGGVVCWGSSSPTLTNCTITGNSARYGGGVYCDGDSAPILTNCTITGNSVAGVICRDRASLVLKNCIVWDNAGGSIESEGSTPQVSYSCIETPDVWPGEGNINDAPRFEREGLFDTDRFVEVQIGDEFHELPDFIVEWPDYHLRPGSACIDSGTSDGAPETDIEGSVRPCGAGVDMGAFETGDCVPFRFLRGDCNGDGNVDLADAVCTLDYLFAGGGALGCLAAANTNGDPEVNLPDAIHVLNFLFAEGPAPVAPFPDCGRGMLPADAALGCLDPPNCQ